MNCIIATREQWLRSPPRSARRGEGPHAAQRRSRRPAPEPALGPHRQDLCLRHREPAEDAGKNCSRGRSQLLVYHFMFGPDYKAGCPSCSMIADGFDGFAVHLANHDVMLMAVSRAPLAKLSAYKRRMGWTFPWASSQGGDFNFDFNVSFTEAQEKQGPVEYNYARGAHAMDMLPDPRRRSTQFAASCGTDGATYRARPAGHERLRAGGRRRLSRLLDLRARPRRPVGRLSMARPRAEGPQRAGHLVAPPRRVRP